MRIAIVILSMNPYIALELGCGVSAPPYPQSKLSHNFEMDLSSLVAGLGNTVGSLIPYKCPRCGETRPISEYDGNIVDGSAECPSCNKDPSPWAARDECKFNSINLMQKYDSSYIIM
jgi:hypothetical protein